MLWKNPFIVFPVKHIFWFLVRKSSRRATATNSLLTSLRRKEREASDKKKKEAGKKPAVGVSVFLKDTIDLHFLYVLQ